MDVSLTLLWGIWAGVLVFDGLSAVVRASYAYLHPHQLEKFVEEHPARVERTEALLEKTHLLPTFTVASTASHLLLGAITVVLVSTMVGSASFGLAMVIVAVFAILLLVMEFIAEGIVFSDLERWAMRLVPLASFLMVVFRPLTVFLMSFLGSPADVQQVIDPDFEDELKNWVRDTRDTAENEGELEQDERKMIYSIFQLGDTLCREIMIPRIDVFSLDVEMPLEWAARAATESGHSRVPVFRDHVDNIVGILYVKDLLKEMLDHPNGDMPPVQALLRPAYFVPETKKVSILLQEMRAREVHLAVVVDEYGGTAGLVTLEDIVEEIVGEIRDEYDQAEEFPYEQLSEYDYVFQGRIDLDDFNDLMDTELAKEMADTLSGYIYRELGRVPAQGETLFVEEYALTLTVVKVEGRRITKVRAFREPPQTETENGSNGSEND
ncbi:MAG: HlyC/CorC family transporter [Anaerolineae bacterium]|nr:HlyC/CorC family transporter [Anaerolineae bacterium]